MVTMPLVEKSTEQTRPSEADPEVPAKATHRVYSPAYKVRVLNEYEGLSRTEKGALLRREGLYSSLIDTWRKQRDAGALAAFTQKRGRKPVDGRDREIERLRRQLARAEADLEKQRKVIEIQGKLSALLEGLAAESAEGESERT